MCVCITTYTQSPTRVHNSQYKKRSVKMNKNCYNFKTEKFQQKPVVTFHPCMSLVWRGHTLRLEEEGSGNSSMNELWKWNLITVKLESEKGVTR